MITDNGYGDDAWDTPFGYDDGPTERALVPYGDAQSPEIAWDDPWDDPDAAWDDTPTMARAAPLIIRGEGTMKTARVAVPRRRRFSTQMLVLVITCCVLVSALFSVGAVAAFSAGSNANPFGALANLFVQSKAPYFWYRAQPGDTFDAIAAKFGVQVNGIFELNGLTIDEDIHVGQSYKIPTDPNYGIGFTPPFPPGVNAYSIRTPDMYILSKDGFQFSAVAGKTNGPNGMCPVGYATWGSNPALYQLINPDIPPGHTTGSHISQRFSSHHDGVDITTGSEGTPIFAAQTGTVIYAAWDNGGGGFTVKISHCGWVGTSYSHMESMAVRVGQNVKQGQFIGLQGQTGDATGPHIHYMLWWENVPTDAVCAYPNGLDGWTVQNEGGAYNGCPPNLDHDAWP
jgi:murein DD-endopeptidase MepM/ murein hydrolase activator NlpD